MKTPLSSIAISIVIIRTTDTATKRGHVLLLAGPTGVGKTRLSLALAHHFSAPIVSVDSRQIYRELPIGTAAPSMEERAAIPHYMVGNATIHDPYNAARYESEVIPLIQDLLKAHPIVLLVGGSMLYISAITQGIDNMPDVDGTIREELNERYAAEGLEGMLRELALVDPEYYHIVDRCNPKRVIHGLEVFRTTGQPLSSFRTNTSKERPFTIIPFELTSSREELYNRINTRTEQMIAQGWLDEARAVYPHRALNALNTIGYKELFCYFDGLISLDEAIHKIQRNTRIYARKQMTWFKKQLDYHRVDASTSSLADILTLLPF